MKLIAFTDTDWASDLDGRKSIAEDLVLFELGTVQKADNMEIAETNKHGKGISGQGLQELKNEASVIAKVRHKHLVRLLGCCIDRDEKILVCEYMPNKSLDFFIFGL
ncbi:G-type lectin S-receptor-like serine/threonine-protein kinase At1g11410 [Citrus sinensis]|uniref:G-type lectin S-receptor-like serine/threonine-protein kinase At1g11410 n=1 Tax=Citrus clementina TaxID=85681 RepID=UPI000CED0D8A|nr:G-type lectin S-receptor-like serine/threonine-protein kinase At1g11410 [Citrus x clementina]XP_052287278.1 G-type lectin S-receptor-like serine/threonine-protein kinase At1g11410 [Citrus sinensis]